MFHIEKCSEFQIAGNSRQLSSSDQSAIAYILNLVRKSEKVNDQSVTQLRYYLMNIFPSKSFL